MRIPTTPEQDAQLARRAHSLEERSRLRPYPRGDSWYSTAGGNAPKCVLERILDRNAALIVFSRVELDVSNDTVIFARTGRESLLEVLAAGAVCVGSRVDGSSEGIFSAVWASRFGEGVRGRADEVVDGPGVTARG